MWKEIHVAQEIYTISSELIGDKWKIMLTNLMELWIEVISKEEIIDKCQVNIISLISTQSLIIDFFIEIFSFFNFRNTFPRMKVSSNKEGIQI